MIFIAAGINLIVFMVGVFAPALKVTPHLGESGSYDFLGQILYGDEFHPMSLSIFDTLVKLYEGGDYFICSIIFLFTILFPLLKMYFTFAYGFQGVMGQKAIRVVSLISKFSMLDVFVIALILISIKALPGGSTAEIQYGAVFFFLNVILTSLLLFWIIKRKDSVL